ncbi:hypothetical protein ASG11_13405 [Sphingomonas sp. Leaf357]|uniref:hypothetical protein n=1 Tax=Sphingomonas sp. Leaf357 TaxID=1736350 RepID=UPI0006F82544|nr:hypothetical protein [Sphingomonas sp. Leaf357]KQS01821.1 hypothetical protein ASG11_13405 [Sphingomonas sp. Leaf357]
MAVKHKIVLRDGAWAYWLTIEPPHPKHPDEYIQSRATLYQRAVAVLILLGTASCRDETTEDRSNFDTTNTYFTSRQPWANNEYRSTESEREPSFFDANLFPQ